MKRSRLLETGLVLLGAVGVFVAGRLSATPPARGETPSPSEQAPACSASPRAERSEAVSKAARAVWAAGDERAAEPAAEESEADPNDPLDKAAGLVAQLWRVVPRFDAGPGFVPPSPEQLAEATRPYVKGFAVALDSADPLVLQAVTDEITEKSCADSPLEKGERIVFAQLAVALPRVLTGEALDCFLSQTKGTEDGPVWDMVEAWRASGLEKTQAIADLEATAEDPRTRSLFLSHEDMEEALDSKLRDAVLAAHAEPAPGPADATDAPVPLPQPALSGAELPPDAPVP